MAIPRLLRWARDHADLIGLSGLGRTLEDGHSHTVRWRLSRSPAALAGVMKRVGQSNNACSTMLRNST